MSPAGDKAEAEIVMFIGVVKLVNVEVCYRLLVSVAD
jgi:hypothetical protein